MRRRAADVVELMERIVDPYYAGRLAESIDICADAAEDESRPARVRSAALDMWAWTVLCEVEAGARGLAQWRPPIEDTLAEARRLGGRRARDDTSWTWMFLGCLSEDPAPAARRAARAVNDRNKPHLAPEEHFIQLECALCFTTAAARTGRWLEDAQNLYAAVARSVPDHCRLPGVRRHLEAALGRPVQA